MLNFIVSDSITYDDNFFRLPQNSSVPITGKSERSDITNEMSAGFQIDKPVSLQKFHFDMHLTKVKHQNYDFMDYDTTNYKALWDWAITPYLTGTIASEQTESSNGFSDFNSDKTKLNLNTNTVQRVNFDWSPFGNWHLLGGLSENDSQNQQQIGGQGNPKTTNAELGTKYVFPSGTSVTLRHTTSSGGYQRTLDNNNKQDSTFNDQREEIALDWPVTGKSHLTLTGGYAKREHDHFAVRDFDALVGNANFNWDITGKTSLSLTASRDIASDQSSISPLIIFQSIALNEFVDGKFATTTEALLSANASYKNQPDYSYYITQNLAAQATWSITPKIYLRSGYTYTTRDYDGRVHPETSFALRSDQTNVLSIDSGWAPMTALSINASYAHIRSSSSAFSGYKDNSLSLSAQFTF